MTAHQPADFGTIRVNLLCDRITDKNLLKKEETE